MNSRKQKLIIIGSLCLFVVCLSVAYATISASLKISGTAKVDGGKWDVHFVKNEKKIEKKGLATCDFGTVEDTSITGLSAKLKAPGDTCTFTVPVENTGDFDASLTNVVKTSVDLTFTGSGSNKEQDEALLKKYVSLTVMYGNTEITDSTDFDNINTLKPGDKKKVTLKIAFSSDATDIPKEKVEVGGLDREFVFDNLTREDNGVTECDNYDIVPTPVTTPNAPVLNGDMIPVYYEKTSDTEGQWKVADSTNADGSWYNYTNQMWANAVTVTQASRDTYKGAAKGTPVLDSDINTMWVWIPRYSYTIMQKYGKGSSCENEPTISKPGEIDVKFVTTETTDKGTAQYTSGSATNWKTNEAFNFGGENKAGIWVSKFEPTGTLGTACTNDTCDISTVTVLPSLASIRSQRVSSFFYMARSMQKLDNPYGFSSTSGNLHMLKNDEWGAVAYLSQSMYGKYGNSDYTGANKEVYINNSSDYITGNSGGKPWGSSASGITYAYNNLTSLGEGQGQAGPSASTTGTIYGVYDMSGGAYEYVMGVLEYDSQTESTYPERFDTASSGFKGLNSSGSETGTVDLPDAKYYNTYKSANPTSYTWADVSSEKACNGGVCYGHALSETAEWYSDHASFVHRTNPWFYRGGYYSNSSTAGVFHATSYNGSSYSISSCRLALAP